VETRCIDASCLSVRVARQCQDKGLPNREDIGGITIVVVQLSLSLRRL
jgi:hypothetical protein